MNARRPVLSRAPAFTLLEMSVVILVLISLLGTGVFVSRKMDDWKIAREASENLRSVYSAKRMLLADRPTLTISSITLDSNATTGIIPYLPSGATTLPVTKDLNGVNLRYRVDDPTSGKPPVYLIDSGGTHYDPSGSHVDGLWDIKELNP